MMNEESTPPQDETPVIEPLNEMERRILGCLVEKAKTTPDAYPLTVNALVTASNQKSNRDPMMELEDVDIEDTLEVLQKKKLVIRVIGGRAERWRHSLYEAWGVNKVELAVLAELLLRGAQSRGELRTRVSRMEPIADLDELQKVLAPLVERELVIYLSSPDKRGAMLTHGLYPEDEMATIRAQAETAGGSGGKSSSPSRAALEQRVEQLESAVSELQQQLTTLQEQLRAVLE